MQMIVTRAPSPTSLAVTTTSSLASSSLSSSPSSSSSSLSLRTFFPSGNKSRSLREQQCHQSRLTVLPCSGRKLNGQRHKMPVRETAKAGAAAAAAETSGDSSPAGGSATADAGSAAAISVDLNMRPEVRELIQDALNLDMALRETNLEGVVEGVGERKRGKVRDVYDAGDKLLVVTTDRQSAFDRVLAAVPFKGQVLNETSQFWFSSLAPIASSAFLAAPDPNVTIFEKCQVFPVEFVVRGFITGSTETSLWTVYKRGVRDYCGNKLPEGMRKNEKLESNILTPTTKSDEGDRPISPDEIISQGLMSADEWQEASQKSLAIFQFGQQVAREHGLILVDTKYEFGKTRDGRIVLIDEVHTPDSSRFWIAASYDERHGAGQEPESIDKEFLRLWFKNNCDPYNDEVLPAAPPELVSELSSRYILLYETITGKRIELPSLQEPVSSRIERNIRSYFSSG